MFQRLASAAPLYRKRKCTFVRLAFVALIIICPGSARREPTELGLSTGILIQPGARDDSRFQSSRRAAASDGSVSKEELGLNIGNLDHKSAPDNLQLMTDPSDGSSLAKHAFLQTRHLASVSPHSAAGATEGEVAAVRAGHRHVVRDLSDSGVGLTEPVLLQGQRVEGVSAHSSDGAGVGKTTSKVITAIHAGHRPAVRAVGNPIAVGLLQNQQVASVSAQSSGDAVIGQTSSEIATKNIWPPRTVRVNVGRTSQTSSGLFIPPVAPTFTRGTWAPTTVGRPSSGLLIPPVAPTFTRGTWAPTTVRVNVGRPSSGLSIPPVAPTFTRDTWPPSTVNGLPSQASSGLFSPSLAPYFAGMPRGMVGPTTRIVPRQSSGGLPSYILPGKSSDPRYFGGVVAPASASPQQRVINTIAVPTFAVPYQPVLAIRPARVRRRAPQSNWGDDQVFEVGFFLAQSRCSINSLWIRCISLPDWWRIYHQIDANKDQTLSIDEWKLFHTQTGFHCRGTPRLFAKFVRLLCSVRRAYIVSRSWAKAFRWSTWPHHAERPYEINSLDFYDVWGKPRRSQQQETEKTQISVSVKVQNGQP